MTTLSPITGIDAPVKLALLTIYCFFDLSGFSPRQFSATQQKKERKKKGSKQGRKASRKDGWRKKERKKKERKKDNKHIYFTLTTCTVFHNSD